MRILIDPSELSENSLLPQFDLPSEPNPELEAITGADFAIAEFPLPIDESTVEAHIKDGTIFVNRKSGYDLIGNYEQIWREIARKQLVKIPPSQFYILPIGKYYPGKNDLLRITSKRPLENNEKLTYTTYLKFQEQVFCSGARVFVLNDESEIESWIRAIWEIRQDIKKRNGKKELYIQGESVIYEPQEADEINYLQEVIEIPRDDMRSVLACGLPNLGQTRINNLIEYGNTGFVEKYGYKPWGIYWFKILTDEDSNGKAAHNVKGIGDGLRKQWRNSLSLANGFNLDIKEIEFNADRAYMRGWNMALEIFLQLVKDGKPATEAWQMVKNNTFELMES